MKSIFLKLSSLCSGAARRHCPFTSIIHKHISLFLALVLLLTYVLLVPVSVEASSLPSGFQPYIRPVYNTTIEEFQAAYSELSGDELSIFLVIAGAYVMNYAGLGDFGLVFEDPPQDATIKERLEFFGQQLIDTIFLPQNLFNSVFDPILSYLQGAVTKAKNTTMTEFEADLGGGGSGTSFGVLLPYNADLVMSFNQFYYRYKGLYQWQFDSQPFVTSNYVWNEYSLSGFESSYNQILNTFSKPYISLNIARHNGYGYWDVYLSYPESKELVLFLDSDNGSFYVRDLNSDIRSFALPYVSLRGSGTTPSQVYNNTLSFSYSGSINLSQYSTLLDAVNTIFNFNYHYVNGNSLYNFKLSDAVQRVFVGSEWGTKSEIFNIGDLGISNTVSNNLEVPKSPTLLDLSAVIESLQGLGTNINDLRTVITDNSYLANSGQIVVQNDFDLSTLSEIIPQSGIVVPEGLFGSSKGFIDYLWFMTKPLVQYTHDFLGTMWFDGVDGFDFSGPTPIVFGVITLGLIGGLIVKFLL